MTLVEEFLVQCEELLSHEKQLKETDSAGYNELALEAERQEVQVMWTEWRELYKKCIGDPDGTKEDRATVRAKKNEIHNCYISCVTLIGEWKDKLKIVVNPPVNPKVSSSVSVPPCDTEIFHGDYVTWPSFRDLFTAIYVNNKKLSPVEKLYHLFQKTSGEAREINKNIPLTAEGFDIAWANLKSQYENKRILINNQLRTLFHLAQCTHETASGLKRLQRDITNCISVLKLQDIDVESWDPIFVFQCSSKLPKLTLSLWEQSINKKNELPKWEDLNKFLTERFKALESVSDMIGSSEPAPRSKYNNFEKSKSFKVHHTKVDEQKCGLCNASHALRACPKFISMNYDNRLAVINRENRCLNCMAQGHRKAECQSKNTCSECRKRHHTLLHKKYKPNRNNNAATAAPNFVPPLNSRNIQSTVPPSTSSNVQTHHTSVANKTMLATAWINIVTNGLSHRIRALIDPCSDDTFISARIQKLLKLPTRPVSANITGLGGEHLTKCSKIAFFTIGSLVNPNFSIETDALVVQDVTGSVPTHSFENIVVSRLPNLEFADPCFYQSGPVDILLGGNVYPLILLKGVEHGILGSLVAQETVFGWIVTGPTNNLTVGPTVRVAHCTRVSVDDQLSKFWEMEEVPKKPTISEEDRICEQIYQSTTVRTKDGRYMVELPFRPDSPLNATGNSNRYVALSQFLRNEKSLARRPEYKAMYDEVIQNYLDLGHMEKVNPPMSASDGCFYLPHHGVFKPESTTTKLRVVFNASCPSSNGKSLNDALYVGPVLQKDIISLILNWRFYRFVFNADITKMYRQILVSPIHVPYQRILFRSSPDDEVQDYQLKTVTFGVNCAPFLALRTLLKLAEDEKERFPIGSKILKENMYVDDALVGSHSIPEGLEARKQLSAILESAGFQLRKWTANNREILESLPRDHLFHEQFLDFEDKSNAKTLGVRWNAANDSFYFVAEPIENKDVFTKREVLSVIARLFDPLGWLSPVIITAKVLMQNMWLDDTGWDDPIKPLTLLKWKSFVSTYKEIDKINIPRWVQYSPNCKIEFHAFCDSSELAYAAALYARVEVDGNIHTRLLVSKSKVAPIKKMSVPRLELCGALLLANLADSILPQFQVQKSVLFPWSDSTIVLSWLKKPSHNWATFVANRVTIIQEKVSAQWRHVCTEDNPADLATRGLTPLELKENDLWWYGPSWLQKAYTLWPSNPHIPDTSLEARPTKVHIARSAPLEDILERFSCLSRAIHVVAYIFRFFNHTHPTLRKFAQARALRLSAVELTFARYRLMSMSQRIYFPQEYACLTSNQRLQPTSPLLTLTPFLDRDQLVRANGRLGSTLALSYNERHPVILAYQSVFSRLYVDFIHQLTMHGGIQLTHVTVRLECWIIRAKKLIKTRISRCKECVLSRNVRQGQIMASLPAERTALSRPFTNTGIDFAGPFEFKTFNGRGCRLTKGYVCLFVCFATKAIHLEPVSDLSTPAFLAALSRFVSRRGCPIKIYSDNGRNFVGAARELQTNLAKFVSELRDEVVSRYGFQRLEWHFIPAAAPHMGGLWEAGVKSCKTHLKKMSGQIRHTFEEFATILASIEACLNSRPLTPLSSSPDDLTALTPGHFLIGSSMLIPAEPEEISSKTALLNRWRKLKIVQQEFCRRWKLEYLAELHKRTKWKLPQEDVQLNDLVVLRQEGIGTTDWRLGRVVKVHPGRDHRVRVVDLKTQAGTITRPIHKLVLLPKAQ